MKKLLASALLSGLLLGTTSTVLAATVTDLDPQGETITSSEISADFEVEIPDELTIDLTDPANVLSQGAVELTSLSANGDIDVSAVTTDLTLEGTGTEANEIIVTDMTNGVDETLLEEFSLNLDSSPSQPIQIVTDTTPQEVIAGEYSGTITFTMSYNDGTTAE